jgi:hypothetical protein
MWKKFEYTEMVEQQEWGTWLWLLDGETVNPKKVLGTGREYYETLSLVQALNIVGEDGWQAVDVRQNNDTVKSYIILLMREVTE